MEKRVDMVSVTMLDKEPPTVKDPSSVFLANVLSLRRLPQENLQTSDNPPLDMMTKNSE